MRLHSLKRGRLGLEPLQLLRGLCHSLTTGCCAGPELSPLVSTRARQAFVSLSPTTVQSPTLGPKSVHTDCCCQDMHTALSPTFKLNGIDGFRLILEPPQLHVPMCGDLSGLLPPRLKEPWGRTGKRVCSVSLGVRNCKRWQEWWGNLCGTHSI